MPAETEQRFVHGTAVVRRGVIHRAVAVDGVFQFVPGQRHPGRADQGQLRTGPLAGHEEPVPDDAAPADRLQTGPDRAVLGDAVTAQPAELQPGVAEPLGMRVPAAQQQVPFHPLVAVTVRFDPVRGQLAVQQERERQRQDLRLAGTVVAAQQQPPVVEVEFFHVVVEEVDEAGAQRLPAVLSGRNGNRGRGRGRCRGRCRCRCRGRAGRCRGHTGRGAHRRLVFFLLTGPLLTGPAPPARLSWIVGASTA